MFENRLPLVPGLNCEQTFGSIAAKATLINVTISIILQDKKHIIYQMDHRILRMLEGACFPVSENKRLQACANALIHIILHLRRVSFGHLFSIETFYSIQWFCLRTANALIRLRRFAGWSWPSLSAYARRHFFAWRGPNGVQRKVDVARNGTDHRSVPPVSISVHFRLRSSSMSNCRSCG